MSDQPGMYSFAQDVSQRLNRLRSFSPLNRIDFPVELSETLQKLQGPTDSHSNPGSSEGDIPPPDDLQQDETLCDITFSSASVGSPLNKSALENEVRIMKLKTNQIGNLVENKIRAFQQANAKHYETHRKQKVKVDALYEELNDLKGSLLVLLNETNSTKKHIKELKTYARSLAHSRSASGIEEPLMLGQALKGSFATGSVTDKVKEVQQEMGVLSLRFEQNVQEMQMKNIENYTLKNSIWELQAQLEGDNDEVAKTQCAACDIW